MRFELYLANQTHVTITDKEHDSQNVEEFVENYYTTPPNWHRIGPDTLLNLDNVVKIVALPQK